MSVLCGMVVMLWSVFLGGSVVGIGVYYMRIYLDTCCYCRPFDDKTQVEICVESSVILMLFSMRYSGLLTLLGSSAIVFEIMQNPDVNEREEVLNYYAAVNEKVLLGAAVRKRAVDIRKYGLKPFDSLHFALAESAKADALLTVDKDFLKNAKKIKSCLSVKNPVDWFSMGEKRQ